MRIWHTVIILISLLSSLLVPVWYSILQESGYTNNWPQVDGKITSSEVHSEFHKPSEYGRRFQPYTTYEPRIKYEYEVNNVRFINDEINNRILALDKDGEITRNIVALYPVGKVLPVYFNPSNPAVSVIERGFSWENLVFLMALIGVALAGPVFVYIDFQQRKRKRKRNDEDVRNAAFATIFVFIIAALGLSFLFQGTKGSILAGMFCLLPVVVLIWASINELKPKPKRKKEYKAPGPLRRVLGISFLLSFAGFFAYIIFDAFQEGWVSFPSKRNSDWISLAQNPEMFWLSISLWAAGGVVMLLMVYYCAIDWLRYARQNNSKLTPCNENIEESKHERV